MPQSTPLQFEVPDMNGASSIESITRAVHEIDAQASVTADLETKRVVIGSKAEAYEIAEALTGAGFRVTAAN